VKARPRDKAMMGPCMLVGSTFKSIFSLEMKVFWLWLPPSTAFWDSLSSVDSESSSLLPPPFSEELLALPAESELAELCFSPVSVWLPPSVLLGELVSSLSAEDEAWSVSGCWLPALSPACCAAETNK